MAIGYNGVQCLQVIEGIICHSEEFWDCNLVYLVGERQLFKHGFKPNT